MKAKENRDVFLSAGIQNGGLFGSEEVKRLEVGDCVRCHACSVSYRGWQVGDNALEVHRRDRPECPYIHIKKTKNYTANHRSALVEQDASPANSMELDVSTHQLDQPAAAGGTDYQRDDNQVALQALREMNFFKEEDVMRAVEVYKDRNGINSCFKAKNLMEIIFEFEEEWQAGGQLPEDEDGDCVRCYACSISYRGWQVGDNALEVHRRDRPECPYIHIKKTKNYTANHRSALVEQDASPANSMELEVSNHQPDQPAAAGGTDHQRDNQVALQAVREFYKEEDVMRAVEVYKKRNGINSCFKAKNLMEIIFEFEEEWQAGGQLPEDGQGAHSNQDGV